MPIPRLDKPPTPEEIQAARDNVIAWLRWVEKEYAAEIPTRTELALRIGVTKGAITQLLDPLKNRAPSFSTLLGVARLVGHPIDYILSHRPR